MNRDELMEKAEEYAMHEHFKREVACYDQILQADPNDVEALANKGMAYWNAERYDEAIKFYEKVVELEPNNSDYWEYMGRVTSCSDSIEKAKKYERVLECYEKSLKIDPENTATLQSKHDAMRILDRNEEALDCISRAIELAPDNAEYWADKVELLDEMGRDDDAILCTEKGLQIEEHGEKPCYGRMLFYRRRYDESIASLKNEIVQKPYDDYLHAFLGMVYGHTGKKEDALACFESSLKLNPNSLAIEFKNKFYPGTV